MLKLRTMLLSTSLAAPLVAGGAGLAWAEQPAGQPPTPVPADSSRAGTAGEMRKGEAMKAGEMGGGSGNTGMPGSAPAQEGNRNQDSRTSKTRDR